MPNGMYGGGRGRKTKVGRKLLLFSSYSIVRLKGLEPPRLSSPDPKSGAATNYATAALDCGAKVMLFYKETSI